MKIRTRSCANGKIGGRRIFEFLGSRVGVLLLSVTIRNRIAINHHIDPILSQLTFFNSEIIQQFIFKTWAKKMQEKSLFIRCASMKNALQIWWTHLLISMIETLIGCAKIRLWHVHTCKTCESGFCLSLRTRFWWERLKRFAR